MRMLSVAEAAKRLGYSKSHTRHLCASGRIRGAVRIGRDWVVPDPPEVKPRGRST